MFTPNENEGSFADMTFLVRALQVSKMIEVAAALELADRVAEAAKPITTLALEAGAEPTMPLRLCRALTAFGIFTVDNDGNLSQTAFNAPAPNRRAHASLRRPLLRLAAHHGVVGESRAGGSQRSIGV